MPQISEGLYQVNVHQTIGLNQILNVFWYAHTGGANDQSNQLWNAFNTDIMPELATIQHTSVNYDLLEVSPVFGTSLPTQGVPGTTAGIIAGDLLPAFNVASIRLLRSSTELRNGWKRFAGITEGNVSSPGFITAYMDLLDDVAAVLDDEITSSGQSFRPQIVRKPMTTKAEEDFWRAIEVQSCVALNRVTTQNSRKTF